ncbi:MAG: SMC family ATPase [Solirubrobacteraceae bacterium]
MRLGRLRGENFRSFEDFDLDLNTRGLIAVVGDNGAGKSTIFNAVEWALYGNQRGRGAITARRDDAPESACCWVELEFECAGRLYTVSREDRGTAKLIDVATGTTRADTITGVTQEIGVLLGLDREMFCGTFYARQNEIQALDSPEEAKRREQLERLLGIERLRSAEALAAAAAKEQKAVVAMMIETLPDVEGLTAELERIETAARQGNPEVQAARARLDALAEGRRNARAHLESLRVQSEQAHAQTLEAQQGRAAADREQIIRDSFAERVSAAQTASAKLTELQPVAAQAEELSVREREMLVLRDNHQRATTWRGRLNEAMTKTASLADQLAALPAPGDDTNPESLAAAVTQTEQRLDELRQTLAQRTTELQAARTHLDRLEASLQTARRAQDLDTQLAALADAPTRADHITASWQKASTRRSGLATQLGHDEEHRGAIVADGAHAACPRCKRSYGDDWEQILISFERDIETARSEIAELDAKLTELVEQGKIARTDANRAQQLSGERQALGDSVDPNEIALQIEAAQRTVAQATDRYDETQRAIETLSGEVPQRREAAQRAQQTTRERDALATALTSAKRDVEMFSAELAQVDSNGYDTDAHARLSAELIQATEASQRCAGLRDTAASLQLMSGRLAEQDEKLAAARTVADRLTEAALAVALDPQAIPGAQSECERLDNAVDAANATLRDAEVKATAESRAVEDARERLTNARRTEKKLADARREERVRMAVHKALGEFRADASRRERPTLIAEASQLLGTVTKGRYSAIRISDKYTVEVFDGRIAHPLKRFSGGEQDLAGLCVRLGLSRMAARQRGIEAGFTILDEVFGSQDEKRRRLITEQLKALLDAEFHQIFIITHTDDVLEHCDLAIYVTRSEDGISRADGPR